MLHRIARALAETGLDVRTAIVATLGLDVVDAFYVEDPVEGPAGTRPAAVLSSERRAEVASVVLAALTAGTPAGSSTGDGPSLSVSSTSPSSPSAT
ncbi:hypothetical protein FrEUN1fDRAFT_7570 [Parafrankia sp. EUN1f]|nr:hypothetical protein FrEUN1fDRAFT_7570 [Parafrankia sp. EUN1f]